MLRSKERELFNRLCSTSNVPGLNSESRLSYAATERVISVIAEQRASFIQEAGANTGQLFDTLHAEWAMYLRKSVLRRRLLRIVQRDDPRMGLSWPPYVRRDEYNALLRTMSGWGVARRTGFLGLFGEWSIDADWEDALQSLNIHIR